MKKALLIIGLLFFLFTVSCKKKKIMDDPNPIPLSKDSCTIKELTASNRNVTFTYNADGRLISAREVITGTESYLTGNYNYSYNSDGKLIEFSKQLDNGVSGSYEALSSLYHYTYDGSGNITSVITKSINSLGEVLLVDSIIYQHVSASKIEYVKKSYTEILSMFFLTDSVYVYVDLDTDKDPIVSKYKPFQHSYYDTVTLSFSRDTLMIYTEFEYETNNVNYWQYFPSSEIAFNTVKGIKNFTQYRFYTGSGNYLNSNKLSASYSIIYNYDSDGKVSTFDLNFTNLLYILPDYSLQTITKNINYTANYECN